MTPENGVICHAIISVFMSTLRPVVAFSQAEIERLRSTFVELIPYVGSLRERVLTTDLVLSGTLPKEAEEQEQAILSFLAEAIDQATGQLPRDSAPASHRNGESKVRLDGCSVMAMKNPILETLQICVRPRFSKDDRRIWESFLNQMASEKEQECGRTASGRGRA